MEAVSHAPSENLNLNPASAIWTGRILTAFALFFMIVDAGGKVLQLAPYVQGTTELGFAANQVLALGLVELLCVIAYAVPRTSILGAVLLTGWFGGAIASHLRQGAPLFSHTLFPVYVALFVWGGLYLRKPALRRFVASALSGEVVR